MSAPARPPKWTNLLKAIFAACKATGLDDDSRRAVVEQLTGKKSLSDCTAVELGCVLDHLNRGRKQGKQRYEGRQRVRPAETRAGQLSKIDALLAELHRVTGGVHTLKYADAIAKKNGYGECVEFCDGRGLRYVIGALTRTLAFKKKGGRQ
ncbi:MAG: regulatory protein GemA [Zoogloeaceae bacterium]|jgi:phage gp16-like protein|nr:regulatory protein GemA [Zoogloeaceae bacterium]